MMRLVAVLVGVFGLAVLSHWMGSTDSSHLELPVVDSASEESVQELPTLSSQLSEAIVVTPDPFVAGMVSPRESASSAISEDGEYPSPVDVPLDAAQHDSVPPPANDPTRFLMNSGFIEAPMASRRLPTSVVESRPVPAERQEPVPTSPTRQGSFPPREEEEPEWGDGLVEHAGGAVKLLCPGEWELAEVAFGREIRLMAAANAKRDAFGLPETGFWLVYHVVEVDPSLNLVEILEQRINATDPIAGTMQQATPLVVDGKRGFVQRYRKTATTEFEAARVIVPTQWGLFELHAQWPSSDQSEFLGQLLSSVRLAAPRGTELVAGPQTVAASSAFGSWKAHRSRMRLRADGAVEIEWDSAGTVENPGPRRVMQGRFTAQGDLISVQWSDGSKTNYRWKRSGHQLFLTNHEGSISQLRRIYE